MTLHERWNDLRWLVWELWTDLTCPRCWENRLREWSRWDVTEGLSPP